MSAIPALTASLASALTARSLTIGCAESCTGGLISVALTAAPGASRWFFGAIVSYDNSVKNRLLGVPRAILQKYGAVSEETALIMADGARSALGVGCALSVTGIAGPDGGSQEKPVGTVWIGWSDAGCVLARRFLFAGGRGRIRHAALRAALLLGLERLGLIA